MCGRVLGPSDFYLDACEGDAAGIALAVLFPGGDFHDTESVIYLDYRDEPSYIKLALPDRNWSNVTMTSGKGSKNVKSGRKFCQVGRGERARNSNISINLVAVDR